jgi:hypothetical protein
MARRQEDPLVKMDPGGKITDLDEAIRLCDFLSRSTLVPEALRGKAANIFIIIMAGQEMSLPWPVALRTIYSPSDGQIGIRGQLLLAKLREAGHSYRWEETDTSCTFYLKRNAYRADLPDEDAQATFTVDDAIQAGLARRQGDTIVALSQRGRPMPWQQYSGDMLFWRAVAKCVRRGAPEVMLGFEVQGAEAAREPEPEVQLKPGLATVVNETGEPERVIGPEDGLRDLDARMRQEAPAETQPDPGPLGTTEPLIDPDCAAGKHASCPGDPCECPCHTLAEDPPASGAETPASAGSSPPSSPGRAAARAKSLVLAAAFEALGWAPGKYRGEVLKACSMFLRRKVGGVREMTADEMTRLAEELSRLQRKHMDEPDTYPVALADKVEEWREAWEREDIAGYERYTEGK